MMTQVWQWVILWAIHMTRVKYCEWCRNFKVCQEKVCDHFLFPPVLHLYKPLAGQQSGGEAALYALHVITNNHISFQHPLTV